MKRNRGSTRNDGRGPHLLPADRGQRGVTVGPLSTRRALAWLAVAALAAAPGAAAAGLTLGAEDLVQSGGASIDVPGYSVPSFVDWDSDGLPDLVVGEGSGLQTPRVRVYLNSGTPFQPEFEEFSYVQTDSGDLTLPGGG